MTPGERRSVKRLTDPRALRALAHPIRMSLVGMLRVHGPLTATKAAELLGESSASCSFHLRQLAKYGLVEEAGGGKGRERPWRPTTMFTQWPDFAEDPEVAAAAGLLTSVVAENYFDQTMRWIGARSAEPEEWQQAAQLGDTALYVTAEELAEIGKQVTALIDPYLDRQANPELRPPGSRPVTYLHLAFPRMDATGRLAAKEYAAALPAAVRAPGETAGHSPGEAAERPGEAAERPGEAAERHRETAAHKPGGQARETGPDEQ
jgi:DNA-binding transcriptional ArsR family regulator